MKGTMLVLLNRIFLVIFISVISFPTFSEEINTIPVAQNWVISENDNLIGYVFGWFIAVLVVLLVIFEESNDDEVSLFLVSAFAGKDLIQRCYREAVQRKYRFYSYGDAMLIL